MQKTRNRLFLGLLIIILIVFSTNYIFAASTVINGTSNTSQNGSSEENEIEDENTISNETAENEIEEHMEINYPDIKEEDNTFGPLTTEQIIGGAAILIALVGIILAISLYARSRRYIEDIWNEEEYNFNPPEPEEPKAITELKTEEKEEQPKAVQEMEDQKKIEEIKKEREENRKDESLRHQKALDDFYNYAEEIKQETKSKRGKGKHSM